jgi:hypothetical protein
MLWRLIFTFMGYHRPAAIARSPERSVRVSETLNAATQRRRQSACSSIFVAARFASLATTFP